MMRIMKSFYFLKKYVTQTTRVSFIFILWLVDLVLFCSSDKEIRYSCNGFRQKKIKEKLRRWSFVKQTLLVFLYVIFNLKLN